MYLPYGYQNALQLQQKLRQKPASYWPQSGDRRVLHLFHQMAYRVPAYKSFLKKHKIRHKTIKSISDFKQIPTIDKDNYLRKYSLPELCWDGAFDSARWVISTTSGSTGEPFYFPRQTDQDLQYAIMAELYLLTNFHIDKKSTLYIIGFPMGAWIGGVFTYEAIKHVADSGKYKLSIISPGIHKAEIIKAVKRLGHHFDQIIIGSYGPFLKDTIDDGHKFGVDWKKYNIRYIFSAEGFTEKFRDYVLRKIGLTEEDKGLFYRASLNHYGTVDLGTMSYETPLSILARREALKKKAIYKDVFGDTIKLPTLTQYDPNLFYFEEENENLYCSAYSGLPLVRYDLKDHGAIIGYDDMLSRFKDHGVHLLKQSRELGLENTLWKLPFVHVYERDDFSVSFYAFQIYPETIRKALQKDNLSKKVTGKFTMMVKFDKGSNQYFEVNVEMMDGIRSSKRLSEEIQRNIFDQLMKDSSEYRETYGMKQERVLPRIELWKYEDSNFFKPGTKQKWVKK